MIHATNTPRVSVLMPVLDPHPTHFRQAVESVLGQTMDDLELIVVEDPSPRSGRELLADLADPRLRHVCNAERTSFVEQLNQGLQLAQAPWVARIDADDVCEPHRLAQQLQYLEAHPGIDVLGSRIAMIDQLGRSLGFRNYPLDHDAIFQAMSRFNPLAHPTVMFDKRRVLDAGGYETDMLTADYDLWSRLALRGARFANHPEALVRYRVHPQGMKTARLRAMIRSTVAVKERYWRGRMDLGARWRVRAERLLLRLPPKLVLGLFLRIACSRDLDDSSQAAARLALTEQVIA